MFDDQHIGGLYPTDIHDSSSVISHDSDDFSITSNTSIPHETYSDAIQHWPLEKWIHTRFCLTYPVHNWAHDRLVRVLLFGSYCHRQTLPSPGEISTAARVAKGLRLLLDDDIWAFIEQLVLVEGMLRWKELSGQESWKPDFREMSKDERGVMVLFSDATSDSLSPHSVIDMGPLAFQEAAYFLTDPVDLCPDQPDIVGLVAHLGGPTLETSFNVIDIPVIDTAICTCGTCINLQEDLQRIPDNFQMKYVALLASDGRNGCRALESAWDPLFTKTEEWIDTIIMERIESPFDDFFPYASERRLGISVIETLIKLYFKIDSPLDTRQLLRFVTYLRYRHISESSLVEPPDMTQDDFAYLTPADIHADSQPVLSTAGGWLYDNSGGALHDETSTIYFIPGSSAFHIRYLSEVDDDVKAIRMPLMEFVGPIFMPPDHAGAPLDMSSAQPPLLSSSVQGPVTVDLSWNSIHGFPLLRDSQSDKPPSFSANNMLLDDKYGAQISISYAHRLYRTWWRPQVVVGQSCPHKDDYSRVTRCSLTSNQVLLQVKPKDDLLSDRWVQNVDGGGDDNPAEAKKTGAIFFRHHKETTSFLTEPQGPFQHGRLSIVRCGEEEGPVEPLIILGASVGMKAYIFHFKECWHCACTRMRAQRCTLGIAIGTKVVTKCIHCDESVRRADRIIRELGS